MVYITGNDGIVRKFACATCIKGHRSSRCQHTNRQLVEIKRKGRPISQCATCRGLRITKHMHVKCCCKAENVSRSSSKQNPTTTCSIDSLLLPSPSPSPSDQEQEDTRRSSSPSPSEPHSAVTPSDEQTTPSSSPSTPQRSAKVNRRLSKIPICDPSDDIDSDTPVYKPDSDSNAPDRQAVLGELYHTSSEDLMKKIYSPFTGQDHAPNNMPLEGVFFCG